MYGVFAYCKSNRDLMNLCECNLVFDCYYDGWMAIELSDFNKLKFCVVLCQLLDFNGIFLITSIKML